MKMIFATLPVCAALALAPVPAAAKLPLAQAGQAAAAAQSPLPPGKAAGVKKAEGIDATGAAMDAGIAALVVWAIASEGDHRLPAGSTSTTTTSTTGTH